MLLTGQPRRSRVRLSLPTYSFSRDSSVSTAMQLMTGIRFLKWKNFSSRRNIQNFCVCTHSRSNGHLVKRPGLNPSSAEVKNVCCCASTPPHMSSWSICALCCVLLSWENRSQSLIQEIMLSNQININFYTDKLKERKSLRRVCT